mgnify:CR=1 FL=1
MNSIEEGLIVSGTGHRLDKLGGYASWAYNLLVQLAVMILSALKPKKVISGMAIGWDQALAEAAVKLGIPFVAAIPFKGQESRWPKESQKKYHELLARAAEVVDTSNGQPYHPRRMQVRNEWMVDNSDLVVALFNGTKGGTYNCVKYAKCKAARIKNYYLGILPALEDGDSYCGSTPWGGFASVGSHFTEWPYCASLSMG